MSALYVLNGWTNTVHIQLPPLVQASSGVHGLDCGPGLTDCSAWGDRVAQVVGSSSVYVYAGTNSGAFSLGLGSNISTIVVESTAGQPSQIAANVQFAGQRGAAFYSGLNLGIAAAVACACVLYFLRGARGASRSMISAGGD